MPGTRLGVGDSAINIELRICAVIDLTRYWGDT